MFILKMNWVDDKNNVSVRATEPDVCDGEMALTYDYDNGEGCVPGYTFTNLLKSVGYGRDTIAKYLFDMAFDYVTGNFSYTESNRVVKEAIEENGFEDLFREQYKEEIKKYMENKENE